MTGEGVVTPLTNISAIDGADFIVQSRILGETIITQKDTPEGTLGILFDCETQLSPEFLEENNLYRHSELNRDPEVKGLFDDNGRVRPIKLRGVKVSGFWIPLDSVAYTGATLKENDVIKDIGKHKICWKYIPRFKVTQERNRSKAREIFCEMFKEHFETDQLLRNLHTVPVGRFVITKKLHGTSARYGKLLTDKPLKWYEVPLSWFGYAPKVWANVSGSRKVLKTIEGIYDHGAKNYYANDIWTNSARQVFGDKLMKGETVFYEIVGYDDETSIMPMTSTNSLEKFLDKAEYKSFVEQFGNIVSYTYGCQPTQYSVYVYRITHTTVDGDSFDLSWEQVKQRCEKLGVQHVPEFITGERFQHEDRKTWFIDDINYADDRDFSDKIEQLASVAHWAGTSAEGICLRSETYPICQILKHKAFHFKVLEGIIKDKGIVSVEEQDGLSNDSNE